MKKIKKRNIVTIIAAIAAVIFVTVGSVAYFTDRVSGSGDISAGNLKVQLGDVTIETDDVIAPRAIVPMTYTVSNTGTLALDEREKVALTVYKADGTTPVALSASPSEFEIYKNSDVELITGKGYAPKSGATPIGTRVTDGFTGSGNNKIIYQVEQTALNGSDKELGDSVASSVSRDFVVLFRATADNEFQDVTVKIDVLTEAKQHSYTEAYNDDWSELQTKSVAFSTGNQSVVPSKTEY